MTTPWPRPLDRRVRLGTSAFVLASAAAWLGGCRREDPAARYVPSPQAAHAALEAMLSRWQAGDGATLLADHSPQVGIIDQHRIPGQALREYEILGESPGQAARCFAVRLRFDNPEAEARVRYVVVGIDPLYVFRQEDYDLLAHWDHVMPAEPEPPAEDSPSSPDEGADAAAGETPVNGG